MCGARIAQWYRAELRARWSDVRVPTRAGNFSPHHRVQTGSEAHPTGIRGPFPGGKAARAWSWPLNFIYCRQERVELYLHPNTPSWRGDQLKSTGTLLLLLLLLLLLPLLVLYSFRTLPHSLRQNTKVLTSPYWRHTEPCQRPNFQHGVAMLKMFYFIVCSTHINRGSEAMVTPQYRQHC
jgi:hypothetical protein